MLIPEAAICRANSLPIPDEAPVTSAQGPNLCLSSATLTFLLHSACLGLVVSFDHFVTPIACQFTNSLTRCAFYDAAFQALPFEPAGTGRLASHKLRIKSCVLSIHCTVGLISFKMNPVSPRLM